MNDRYHLVGLQLTTSVFTLPTMAGVTSTSDCDKKNKPSKIIFNCNILSWIIFTFTIEKLGPLLVKEWTVPIFNFLDSVMMVCFMSAWPESMEA